MISYEHFQTRLGQYIDAEVLPHMTGVKRMLVGTYASLATKNIAELAIKNKDHPLVAVTGALCSEGIDVEKLFRAADPYVTDGMVLDIPMIGELRFGRGDMERLLAHLRG